MNQSEQEKYDAEFPDHPLTKTRQLLDELKAQIIFSSDFKDLKLFEG